MLNRAIKTVSTLLFSLAFLTAAGNAQADVRTAGHLSMFPMDRSGQRQTEPGLVQLAQADRQTADDPSSRLLMELELERLRLEQELVRLEQIRRLQQIERQKYLRQQSAETQGRQQFQRSQFNRQRYQPQQHIRQRFRSQQFQSQGYRRQ